MLMLGTPYHSSNYACLIFNIPTPDPSWPNTQAYKWEVVVYMELIMSDKKEDAIEHDASDDDNEDKNTDKKD